MIPLDQRAAVVDEIRREFAAHYNGPDSSMACLYWSFYACRVLERRGERALVQAGTLEYPMGNLDDGFSATHFSYVWEPGSAETRRRIAANEMPEMHVWVALPDDGELLDVTTCFFQAQARRLGLTWKGEAPPPWLWERAELVRNRGAFYVPDRRAIAWALVAIGAAPHHHVVIVPDRPVAR